MKLFSKSKKDEFINLQNNLNIINQQTPLLIKNLEEKTEIINLTAAREMNHLKKRMWKFHHKQFDFILKLCYNFNIKRKGLQEI